MIHLNQRAALETFDEAHIGASKGALSFVLIITRRLKSATFPISVEEFRTAKEGQVVGLGGAAVRKILKDYKITRKLSDEGGRTTRGNMGRLTAYADVLNTLWSQGVLDLDEAEKFWVERIQAYFDTKPFTFKLDPAKSLRFCVRQLLAQALARQRELAGTMYAGAVMQHLVGAKLDLITQSAMEHHGFSVADAPSSRVGDFLVGDAAIHVTTAPTENLIGKCQSNLESGLKPIIVTTEDGLGGAKALAKQAALEERIDVIEIEQFLTANVYERSGFARDARTSQIQNLIDRYNIIVSACESDPSLRIEFEP